MTEAMKINHFYAHSRKEAPQAFRNMSASNRKVLDDVLLLFGRKYFKPESQATPKHKRQKLMFGPNTRSLSDSFEKLNECAERAFGDNALHMIDTLPYTNLPLHLKRSLNLAYLETGSYDQTVAHLHKELELSGLEIDGELSLPPLTVVPPNGTHKKQLSKIVGHYCEQTSHVMGDRRRKMKN